MRQIRRRFIAGSNELRFYCAFCNYECYPVNNGEIFISLARKGRKVVFKVSNESEMIQKGNMDILFERFYRTDASRSSETGGSELVCLWQRQLWKCIMEKFMQKVQTGRYW